jgi:maltose O-acetyltransferase
VIQIGKAGISGSAICAVKGIYIDDYSGLGANASIYDTDFHLIDPTQRRNQKNITEAKCAEVRIGKDVWIAANATILKGVEIGDGAVIGAGAVVTSRVPPRTIYAGNPAVKIKDI